MPLNPYSEAERIDAMLAACYAAVAEHFSHLPVRYIIDPPHHLYDAMLARPIAIHIANVRFEIPRRRIAELLNRQRTSISFGCQQVNRRRREPCFEAAYVAMALRAKELFIDELRKAAA